VNDQRFTPSLATFNYISNYPVIKSIIGATSMDIYRPPKFITITGVFFVDSPLITCRIGGMLTSSAYFSANITGLTVPSRNQLWDDYKDTGGIICTVPTRHDLEDKSASSSVTVQVCLLGGQLIEQTTYTAVYQDKQYQRNVYSWLLFAIGFNIALATMVLIMFKSVICNKCDCCNPKKEVAETLRVEKGPVALKEIIDLKWEHEAQEFQERQAKEREALKLTKKQNRKSGPSDPTQAPVIAIEKLGNQPVSTASAAAPSTFTGSFRIRQNAAINGSEFESKTSNPSPARADHHEAQHAALAALLSEQGAFEEQKNTSSDNHLHHHHHKHRHHHRDGTVDADEPPAASDSVRHRKHNGGLVLARDARG